jgi:putative transcriptional regulator
MTSQPNHDSPSFTSLVDHCLIAMPQLRDSYFANTVVYIWRHSEEGALGLVVNLPIKMQLDEVFEQLGVSLLKNDTASQIVLSGGPVETEKGFILHDAPPRWPSSIAITDALTITTSRDILADIGRGEGPSHFLLALGCAGWSPGQLEQEIRDNAWFTCPATQDIIFSTDYANKPEMAAASLGFSLSQLTTDVGYS